MSASLRLTLCASLLSLGLAVSACQKTDSPKPATVAAPAVEQSAAPASPAEADKATTPGATAKAKAPAAVANAGDIIGTVKETMDSGGYTYALLDTGAGEVWVAGPQTKAAVGDKLEANQGALMKGFTSKTLERTFEQIHFVDYLRPAGSGSKAKAGAVHGAGKSAAARPANPHAKSANPHAKSANPHAKGAGAAEAVEPVEALEGGMTVAQVWADVATLSGKSVSLRGRVVKLNRGILGSDWLHVQDGTGAADKGDHDLTVTTAPGVSTKVGDVVVVKGTVVTDKDFGAGYRYPVMIEKATVTVE